MIFRTTGINTPATTPSLTFFAGGADSAAVLSPRDSGGILSYVCCTYNLGVGTEGEDISLQHIVDIVDIVDERSALSSLPRPRPRLRTEPGDEMGSSRPAAGNKMQQQASKD